MKIRPMGAEMFHADGQMDGHRHVEAKAAFRIFANASEHWFLDGYKGPLEKKPINWSL
jgi:hypothetical protein